MIGIDLGTTNSLAAIWADGAPRLIPNSLGEVLTPSAVGLGDDGELLVGMAARERQATHPELTASAFKRFMGTGHRLRLGGREFLPEELSALVLARLKADAEDHLRRPVDSAVVTVPAYFNDRQRKATRRAGELAGLRIDRLINEPTAAALAYGLERREDETIFMVIDLGGGTFDVSVLEIFEGVLEVRATAGDVRLGGEDFDALIVQDMFARHAGAWAHLAGTQRTLLEQRVRERAQVARRQLTERPSATIEVPWSDASYGHTLTRESFAELSRPLLARLREPVLRTLRDAELHIDRIADIVLVGGATRMPVVRDAVRRMFGREGTIKLHPDQAVALGAAVQVGLAQRDAAVREVVLTDVCPFTLSTTVVVEAPGGIREDKVAHPVIERGTVIPASREVRVYSVYENQAVVSIEARQGESRNAEDNVLLGTLSVPIPRGPAGVEVRLRFTYDVSGLLEVDATVPATGTSQQLVINEQEAGLSAAELRQMRQALASMKVPPRSAEANLAALARGHRCYEGLLGRRREEVGRAISEFNAALETQDPLRIARARVHFLARLDDIEAG